MIICLLIISLTRVTRDYLQMSDEKGVLMWRTYFTYMTLIKEKAAEKPALAESVLGRHLLFAF